MADVKTGADDLASAFVDDLAPLQKALTPIVARLETIQALEYPDERRQQLAALAPEIDRPAVEALKAFRSMSSSRFDPSFSNPEKP